MRPLILLVINAIRLYIYSIYQYVYISNNVLKLSTLKLFF